MQWDKGNTSKTISELCAVTWKNCSINLVTHYVFHHKQLSAINKLITLLIIHANSVLHFDHLT